jgi:hypothetical protein
MTEKKYTEDSTFVNWIDCTTEKDSAFVGYCYGSSFLHFGEFKNRKPPAYAGLAGGR